MKQRILIVEDEPSILDNISYALGKEGFVTVGCNSGEEALTLCQAQAFDLVILDIGLPDQNGFEVCRTLRERSDVPVIFLTARAEEVDRIVGLEIGADDYVTKPFSPRELSARVRAVLRRYQPNGSAEEPGAAIRSEPTATLWIDEDHACAHYFGEVVSLSSTEFRLLRTFCAHPGRVLSRAQLMEVAWDEPEAAMERTVDAHVKSLRAKLRKVRSDSDPIQTHRGFGYSLKEVQ